MKIKCRPEDFEVAELTSRVPAAHGDFALYLLTKRGVGTPEAIDEIARRWNLPQEAISFGGLKDRHALTRQFVTVRGGSPRELHAEGIDIACLGRTDRPFTPADISGNRFRVVMRDLDDAEVARAEAALADVARDGLPNYYDDQRFGSLGESGEFVARPWTEGNFERALQIALTDPNEHDGPRDREEKETLRARWEEWKSCEVADPLRRSVVDMLARRPWDWKGAFALIPKTIRGLYLSSFQAWLWNRILGELLLRTCGEAGIARVPLRTGSYPFFRALDDAQRAALRETQLPLPSSRMHLEPGPVASLVDEVLAREGLVLRRIRVKFPKDCYFAKGWRAAVDRPDRLSHSVAADDLYPGRRALTLSFDLPRGAYATILVKRLTEM